MRDIVPSTTKQVKREREPGVCTKSVEVGPTVVSTCRLFQSDPAFVLLLFGLERYLSSMLGWRST